MKITPFLAAFAAILLPLASLAQTAGETVIVVAKGVGATAQSAEKAALRSAVEKVVGMLVDAETLVKNDELVEDQILTYSKGYVETFESLEGPSKNEEGLVFVKIRATVKKGKLNEKIQAAVKTSVAVDGAGLFAELTTRRNSIADAKAMLDNLLKDVPLKLLTAKVVTTETGKPKMELDAHTGHLKVDVVLKVDAAAYSAWVSQMTRFFDTFAAEKNEGVSKDCRYPYHYHKIVVMVPQGRDIDFGRFDNSHFSDLNLYRREWDTMNRLFKLVNYRFDDDAWPVVREAFGSRMQFASASVKLAILDSEGNVLAERTVCPAYKDARSSSDARYDQVFVLTKCGIAPGWNMCNGSEFCCSTMYSTIDFGPLASDVLRKASKFECVVLAHECEGYPPWH